MRTALKIPTLLSEGGSVPGWILDSGIWNNNKFWDDAAMWRDTDLLNPIYQDVLDEATSQGYTLPSVGVQEIQNILADYLVYSGVYNKAESIIVLTGDGDNNFKLIDWKLASKIASISGTVNFSNTLGASSDGTTGYINAGYNTITRSDYLNNLSFYVHIPTSNGTSGRSAFGQITQTALYNMFRPSPTGYSAFINSGGSGSTWGSKIGRFLLTRSLAASFKVYQNNSLIDTIALSTTAGVTVGNMVLLGQNNSLTSTPSVSNFYDGDLAIYISGQDIESELALFDAGYTNYYNSLLAL